jgi:hypothetical protein
VSVKTFAMFVALHQDYIRILGVYGILGEWKAELVHEWRFPHCEQAVLPKGGVFDSG